MRISGGYGYVVKRSVNLNAGTVEGAFAVMLMGYDCIAIDEVQKGEAGFDVQTMAVEYGMALSRKSGAPLRWWGWRDGGNYHHHSQLTHDYPGFE